MATKWELRGKGLAEELKDITDDKAIEGLAKGAVAEIIASYPHTPTSRKSPLAAVRKAVETAFPGTKKKTSDYQYFTKSGKGNVPRYEHLALKYLTLPKEDWDALGDDARKEYQAKESEVKESDAIASTPTTPTAPTIPTTPTAPTIPTIPTTPTAPTIPTTPTIEPIKLADLKIELLELDTETQQSVLNALENSGKSLALFIQQACKVYANTVNGRAKADTDLSTVPTSELLDTDITQYKTHPKKIEELTRRAIKAIMTHNDNCTETDQKWFLSATAINSLTGSRVQSVNEILKDYKQMVDDHNAKHGLTAYTNRGAKNRVIKNEIPMASLVPDGIDL